MLVYLWEFVNSLFFVTVVGTGVIGLLGRLYASRPEFRKSEWEKYEGAIIRAIRWAEKAVPTGVENSHVKRFTHALNYVLTVYEEIERRKPTVAEEQMLANAIELICERLETEGVLSV